MSRLVAVLTAAGSGSRLGCAGPKALVPLAHRPLLWWAARALVEAGATAIVVTAPAEAVAEFRSALEGVGAEVAVVAGSAASRQASVANGLGALPPLDADDVVLVHDAARPLTPPSMIRRVADAVRSGCDAVIPTVPVADTVKVVVPLAGGLGLVEGTPDRSSLAAVQTPQGFTWHTLRDAHRAGAARAADEGAAATDDAGLVEALGIAVHTVAGDPAALKITRPEDLVVAEHLATRAGAGAR